MPFPRALRTRLALLGFVAIYAPVLLLFAVTFVTTDVDARDVAGQQVVSEGQDAPSAWVTWTVVALAPVAAAAAWTLAGRAVRPIERVRSVADEISASDLSRRIALNQGPTEVVALAASFDSMLARLDAAARVQRRLVEEANHELRTPLAVLRTNADVLLDHPAASLELYAEGLRRSRRIASHMQATVEGLLVDARGRARTIDRRPVDVVALVRDVLDGAHVLAVSTSVVLRLEAPDCLVCGVDEPTVRRAVANLVDNALRYAPPGSAVELVVREDGDQVQVLVSDHGPGIPADRQASIFERFWHGTDPQAGSGLGLPIARQVALAHDGDLTVTSPGDAGDGATFTLSLRR